MSELYSAPEFIRGWRNDASFHVAENAIQLRKFRHLTQTEVAALMGSSQSAVARIEGGDENITLSTLKRLVIALKGRLFLSFPPEELATDSQRRWWETPQVSALTSTTTGWKHVFTLINDTEDAALAGWKKLPQKAIAS